MSSTRQQSFEGGFEGCVKYFTTGEGKENLTAQSGKTHEESAVKKALNDEGFTRIEGNSTANNLPNTKKTSGGISNDALKNMPWAEVHQLARKSKEE